MPGRACDLKPSVLRGRQQVTVPGQDVVVIAGVIAREENVVMAGSGPVHDVKVSVDGGMQHKAHDVAGFEDVARVHIFDFLSDLLLQLNRHEVHGSRC